MRCRHLQRFRVEDDVTSDTLAVRKTRASARRSHSVTRCKTPIHKKRAAIEAELASEWSERRWNRRNKGRRHGFAAQTGEKCQLRRPTARGLKQRNCETAITCPHCNLDATRHRLATLAVFSHNTVAMKALLENHSLDCAVRRRSGETREFRSDQPRSASGRRRSDAELVSNQTSKGDQHTNLFHLSNARVASTHYVVRASNEAKIRTGQLHINPDWISDARNSKPRSEQDFKVDSQLKKP